MQEPDRDAGDALLLERGNQLLYGTLIERAQDFAARARTLRHRVAQAPRNQWLGLFQENVVLFEAMLVADLDRVAEAFRGDQCRHGALALDQRVRGERSAVHDE